MDALFPLPVSPFEYYYLCDDCPNYPTTFFVELTFSGHLEREPLESALALVLSRHPLLTARIDMNGGGRPNWLPGEGPQLNWGDEEQSILPPAGFRLDLEHSAGLRVWVRVGRQASRIVLQFHHACCDGLAGLRIVEELLLAYHAIFGADDPRLPPLDPLLLRRRDERNGSLHGLSWRDRWNTAVFWIRTLARSPALIAAPALPAESAADSSFDFPVVAGIRTVVLDSDQMRALRVAAAKEQATLNDLLLRDLFLVLAKWNAAGGAGGGPLRINVPTSLRDNVGKYMPAVNALGFTFLTRKVRLDDDPRELLASIRQEMAQIKRDRAGRYFLDGLGFACGFPGLLAWALARPRSFATIVFSNLGRIYARTPLPRRGRRLVCGEAVLERVAGVPPIRHLTRAAMAVIQYADETTISMHYDRRYLSPPAADDLLAMYAAHLTQSISGPIPAKDVSLTSAIAAQASGDG